MILKQESVFFNLREKKLLTVYWTW